MLILSFSLGMSMEVRRRQTGQVREEKLRYSLNRLFQVGAGVALKCEGTTVGAKQAGTNGAGIRFVH
jgi:hypothetical protein